MLQKYPRQHPCHFETPKGSSSLAVSGCPQSLSTRNKHLRFTGAIVGAYLWFYGLGLMLPWAPRYCMPSRRFSGRLFCPPRPLQAAKTHAVLAWRRHVFSRAIPDIATPLALHHSTLVCSRPDFILDTSSRPISHRTLITLVYYGPPHLIHTVPVCWLVYLLAISTGYLGTPYSVSTLSCCQLGGVIGYASSIVHHPRTWSSRGIIRFDR